MFRSDAVLNPILGKFILDKSGTGYFSSSLLGLPRCRIVDSNLNVAAIFACQSSLPNAAKKTGRRKDFSFLTVLDNRHR